MKYDNPVEILANLVDALNSTYWSSWQNTANFSDCLRVAEEYLSKFEVKEQS